MSVWEVVKLFSASIENSTGNVLKLTGKEPVYQVIDIQGLNPPAAQINTSTIVGLDGAVFNSSKLQTRNLVLTVKINGDVERNRLNLYSYFRTKEWCRFYYSNGSLDVSIEGYVDTVECNLFTNAEIAQISIVCPYPYFRSIYEVSQDFSNVLKKFVFPFSINIDEPVVISEIDDSGIVKIFNSSEAETGFVMYVNFLDSASSLEIINTFTGDDFKVTYSFLENDSMIIDTNKGRKSINLIRSGAVTNLFSALQTGSIFLQLLPGINTFNYKVSGSVENNDDVRILLKYYNIFRGV